MPFVENNGAHLFYETQGQGSDLVFLHGGGGNSTSWFRQIPHFAKSWRCTFIDNRCFGRSYPTSLDLADPKQFASDVLAVLDAAEIERAGFVCQSMGGWTGLRLALKAPERVSAFVCSNSPMGVNYPPALADVMAFSQDIAARGEQIEDAALSPSFRESKPDEYWLYSQLNMFNAIPLRGAELGVPLPVVMQRLFAPDYMLAPEALGALTVPTLLLGGTEDRLVRPATVKALAEFIPGAQVKIFDGAGHSPYFEVPDQFNAQVASFLSEIVADG